MKKFRCTFPGADLEGADLRGADLEGAGASGGKRAPQKRPKNPTGKINEEHLEFEERYGVDIFDAIDGAPGYLIRDILEFLRWDEAGVKGEPLYPPGTGSEEELNRILKDLWKSGSPKLQEEVLHHIEGYQERKLEEMELDYEREQRELMALQELYEDMDSNPTVRSMARREEKEGEEL